MNSAFAFSLACNLLVLSFILFLFFFGKNLVRAFFFKYVIQVRYDQKSSMFRACQATPGAIIFLGDSITEGGNWDELWENKKILNRGIGGDVSEGVLNRIDEVSRHQPSKVFICIGTNDLAKGIAMDTIILNYKKILDSLKRDSPETKIFVQSVLPVGKKVLFGHNNTKITVLNLKLRKLCIEENLPFIDLQPVFADADGYLREEFTNDNLHLLGSAYLAWKEKIAVEIDASR